MDERWYLRRLSERDLRFLAEAGGSASPEAIARLRAEPWRIRRLIESPTTFDALFAPWGEDPLILVDPFLVFSVLLAGATRELGSVRFVREWIGPRQRLPVFDVETLRAFLGDELRRVFLAELLASYTHVASGTLWVRSGRGWRRLRFNELDPVRLAALLEVLPEAERTSVYRRLGDLALFLTGVFPDFAAERMVPVQVERLERVLAEVSGRTDDVPDEPAGTIGLLERLGRRSYRAALGGASGRGPVLHADLARALEEFSERFGQARRILNFLTDAHLFPLRETWFGPGTG
ncbi:MAG: hypothetical protein ACE14W_11720 [Candidatus Velamenicoccus archaeovorus]